MSAYVTQGQIEAAIPPAHLVDALDDDGDGVADDGLLDAIIARASVAVEGYLAGIYTVPFVTVPPAVAESSFIFACELLYDRRPVANVDKNPWKTRADGWRTRLEKIGSGDLPLEAAAGMSVIPVRAVTEPMRTEGTTL